MTTKQNRVSITLFACVALAACGGTELDGALDESESYVLDGDEAERSAAPGSLDELFEQLASTQQLESLVSRARLVVAADCPERISGEATVPVRCLDIRSDRHRSIRDVDIVEPDAVIHFHALRSTIGEAAAELAAACPSEKQPNQFVDLHQRQDPSFIAAGKLVKPTGEKRYDVVYRRTRNGVYRMLPARPRLDQLIWYTVKPDSGLCVSRG